MPATPQKIEVTADDLADYGRRSPLGDYIEVAQPFFEDTERHLVAYTLSNLRNLPEPEWLIQSLVEKAGFSALAGPYGVGKTFLALDWALCLAHGFSSWNGFDLPGRKTKVLYVLAEGFAWAWQRVQAWKEKRGVDELDDDHLLMVQEAVTIWPGEDNKQNKEIIERLKNTVRDWKPELVVFDTYARVTPGMNENSATEAGKVVQLIDEMRLEMGTAVLLLHHPTKAGQSFRGSNAGPGAADVVTVLDEEKKTGLISLTWDKIKNGATPEEQLFALVDSADSVFLEHLPDQKPAAPSKGRPSSSAKGTFLGMYRSGMFDGATYQEMAGELGVSKATIANWVKEAQIEEPEEL